MLTQYVGGRTRVAHAQHIELLICVLLQRNNKRSINIATYLNNGILRRGANEIADWEKIERCDTRFVTRELSNFTNVLQIPNLDRSRSRTRG